MSRDSKYKHLTAKEATEFASTKIEFTGFQKLVYSLFILGCFVSANLISISHYPKFKDNLLKNFEPLAHITGLGQNWDLFSTTRKVNFHTASVISYGDGTIRLYEFPRVENFSVMEKFQRYKLRKLFYDYLPNPIGVKYRPTVAKFLVNGFYDKDNQPQMISFDFNYAKVDDPSSLTVGGGKRGTKSRHSNHSTIFVYRVRN